ncbi:hypothetical protein [Pontibacter akesuensis]|uniref:Uncharacterized protein n=1 Tax=Pontibacter akesuensis TaxID=388950 RepID=A0A1I7GTM7_9BACT|nr:hypothetical protein [Pontibacter akesuensis]SFU51769.1 hypothetical protein SAMN04487941_1260 [Pontibacter akesuensis]
MESNNQNDRNEAFGSRAQEREMNPRTLNQGNNWSRQGNFRYGRDTASMRGNDYYGSQGINSDYGRGNYSNSTFGAGARGDYSRGTRYGEGGSPFGGGSGYGHSRYGTSRSHGGYAGQRNGNEAENVQNGYGDNSNPGSRNNYGRQGGSQSYSDFINHNYGSRSSSSLPRYKSGYDNSIGNYGKTGYGSTRYNNRDTNRENSTYGSANEGTPYKAEPISRYSENDGRRR